MTRFYLKLLAPLLIVLLMLAVIARMRGTAQPPNPALRGFVEGCVGKPQPCWYGIVPGVTTMKEAGKQLIDRAFQRTSSYTYEPPNNKEQCEASLWSPSGWDDEIVQQLTLNCIETSLEEIIRSLGEPEGIIIEGFPVQKGYMSLAVFKNPDIQAEYSSSLLDKKSRFIFLFAPENTSLQHALNIGRWRGFLATWRYCQLEPDYPDCRN